MIEGDELPTLEGARVRLRWCTERDVDALFAIFSSAEVTRYWSTPPMDNVSQAKKLYDDIVAMFVRRELFEWVVARKTDDKVIGTATLHRLDPDNRRAEIGYALGHEHWGQGLMTEALDTLLIYAFETLGLRRIEADVDPRNAASIRSLERHGFKREGYLRERWEVGGEVQDAVFYGLLRREWIRVLPPQGQGKHG